MDISEKNFEASIEKVLLATPASTKKRKKAVELTLTEFVPGGYRKRSPDDYHRALCLDPDVVLAFIYATQPQETQRP
jgi:hypothetical protein